MSKITVRHVEAGVEDMRHLLESGARIRETPHLGALLTGKYALMMGGLANHIVFVDTIKAGRDKFGQVRDFNGVRTMSNAESEGIAAAAARRVQLDEVKVRALYDAAVAVGVDLADFQYDDGVDLVALHMHVARATAADTAAVTTFAEAWRTSGDIGKAMLHYMASRGLLERYFDARSEQDDQGKRSAHFEPIRAGDDQLSILNAQGCYWDHDLTAHGVVPSVEAMLALQAVNGAIGGMDTYDNLYRLSTIYTRDEAVLARVGDIAHGTLAELGVTDAVSFYGLLVADNDHLDALGGAINQFALCGQGLQFNLDAMLERNA